MPLKTLHEIRNMTASESYRDAYVLALELLQGCLTALKAHREAQTTDPGNYGYVGDLGRVSEDLAYVMAALGDTSAVEKMGLEY